MSTANNSSLIVDQLVTYADWFFPGEIDFDRDLDYRYRIGIQNGNDEQMVVGMRRCISNSSLSDHGESPPQGSPKPATRRKNKPAPTPPSGTPDKNERRNEDKPPPAPDKPPRPLTTSTLNRHTYKSQKHEVNAELINPQSELRPEKPTDKSDREVKASAPEVTTKDDIPANEENETNFETPIQASQEPQKVHVEPDKNSRDLETNMAPIGFEALDLRDNFTNSHIKNNSDVEQNTENTMIKPKPVPAEKPSTLERRRKPVAAPRNLVNSTQPNSGKKLEINILNSIFEKTKFYD